MIDAKHRLTEENATEIRFLLPNENGKPTPVEIPDWNRNYVSEGGESMLAGAKTEDKKG
ncbi:MAG: hypothetical protein O6850_06670 [Acidobacteria bacterium]|nr:hypothetical protein [Acidobacteriota bacterium]